MIENFQEILAKIFLNIKQNILKIYFLCMHKWVFNVLIHLVMLQCSFHVGDNVAKADTRHAGSGLYYGRSS